MKTQYSMACLVALALLTAVAGCSKSETANSGATPADKAVNNLPVEPAGKPEPPPTVTNAATLPPEIQKQSTVSVPAVQTPATQLAPVPSNATPSVVPQAVTSLTGLSQDQMVQGLKDALGKGLQQAVAGLGHDGGFMTNLNVKIPMPEKLQKVEKALRAIKQDKLADDFVTTMNHAAEQAVPAASGVFVDALIQMQIDDAKSILTGPTNAATQYFQRTTRTNLYGKFYPVVQQATQKTGVTAAYKSLMDKANLSQSLGSLGSALGATAVDKDTMDIDAYVTNKTLDGLFLMVADEENRIRQNPVARTTDMLQKVFGAVKN